MKTLYRLSLGCLWSGLFYLPTQAQVITVPDRTRFADMELFIQPDAKEEIQKKVTSLTVSPKHYQEIFELVNLYMPFIEKVLQEEGIPDDLKYIVIQESTLIPDHISSSQAVGFWQFKAEAGADVGLRMDHTIDERMHIIASTRGFARFVKSHYDYFHNWLYALLAHYLGRTGTKNFIAENNWHIQNDRAIIDKKTHWYIYHFIAHKIVFEHVAGKSLHPTHQLYPYHDGRGKTIQEISRHFNVPLGTMKAYNKWLKHTKVPEDASYPMLIPMTHQQYTRVNSQLEGLLAGHQINYESYWNRAEQFPVIRPSSNTAIPDILLINGLEGVVAKAGDTIISLAQRASISLADFIEYNEIDQKHIPVVGKVYYFERKNNKAGVHYHVVKAGETWWSIAQQYGIRQDALLLKNRLRNPETLTPGRVLWLRFIRPASIPIAHVQDPNQSDLPVIALKPEPVSDALPVPEKVLAEEALPLHQLP